jgi:hypothetical protein
LKKQAAGAQLEKLTITSSTQHIPAAAARNEFRARTNESFPAALIALITIATFVPVLQNSFVNWDENVLVGNAGYRGFGWAQINWMFAAFISVSISRWRGLLWRLTRCFGGRIHLAIIGLTCFSTLLMRSSFTTSAWSCSPVRMLALVRRSDNG